MLSHLHTTKRPLGLSDNVMPVCCVSRSPIHLTRVGFSSVLWWPLRSVKQGMLGVFSRHHNAPSRPVQYTGLYVLSDVLPDRLAGDESIW